MSWLLITDPTLYAIRRLWIFWWQSTLTFYNPTNTNSGAGEFGCNAPCDDGFSRNAVGSCEDVNECLGSPCAGANQVCLNTEGSFSCDCDVGFKLFATLCVSDSCDNFPELCSAEEDCVGVEGKLCSIVNHCKLSYSRYHNKIKIHLTTTYTSRIQYVTSLLLWSLLGSYSCKGPCGAGYTRSWYGDCEYTGEIVSDECLHGI